MFSRFINKYKDVYLSSLTPILPLTTSLGLLSYLVVPSESYLFRTEENNNKITGLTFFKNTIGYTTIGFAVGLIYPVSFPLIAGHVLYTNADSKKN